MVLQIGLIRNDRSLNARWLTERVWSLTFDAAPFFAQPGQNRIIHSLKYEDQVQPIFHFAHGIKSKNSTFSMSLVLKGYYYQVPSPLHRHDYYSKNITFISLLNPNQKMYQEMTLKEQVQYFNDTLSGKRVNEKELWQYLSETVNERLRKQRYMWEILMADTPTEIHQVLAVRELRKGTLLGVRFTACTHTSLN